MIKKIKTIHFKKDIAHGICGSACMFLMPPTVEELKQSDLQDLVDMLAKQVTEYSQLMKMEGVSSKSIAMKEMILTIQKAIEAKKDAERTSLSR